MARTFDLPPGVSNNAAFRDANPLNASARARLGLDNNGQIRIGGALVRKELDDVTAEIARAHDGKYILRITARERASGKQLKGHLETSLNESQLLELLKKEQFWSGDYIRRLSQFTGYVGEGHIWRRVRSANAMTVYPKTGGRAVAPPVRMTFRPGSTMSLQKPGSEHGLDILGYKTAPPPPGWVVIEVKSTARAEADYRDWGTPRTTRLSTAQNRGEGHVLDRINDALDSFRDGPDVYKLTEAQARILREFLRTSQDLGDGIIGVHMRVGMKEGFQVASNAKYPEMLIYEKWFGRELK